MFLVCYSVVAPASLEAVVARWLPELRIHCRHSPFLLVGTKTDLREDEAEMVRLAKTKQKPVGAEAGEKVARQLGAFAYVECSALTQKGLKNVFDLALQAYLNQKSKPPQERVCCFQTACSLM